MNARPVNSKVLIIGAGASGRGHMGQLAYESGYDLVFLDKDTALCEQLQKAGSYSVCLISQKSRTAVVNHFDVRRLDETEAVYDHFKTAVLIFTAVCPDNLRDVAIYLRPIVIRWLTERSPADFKNVLCCENMNHSSSTFREYLLADFPDQLKATMDAAIGFPDTMIARVVAKPKTPLQLLGEEYSEWTASRAMFRGPILPGIKTLELVDHQDRYLQRKLYIHNTGHATFGYLGFLKGYTYIHEAARDPAIMDICRKAIAESGWAVQKEHGFSEDVIRAYRQALTDKCVCAELPDELLRVTRDPIRKLGAEERFCGPIRLMLKHGRQPNFLLYGMCAALLSNIPHDAQSELLRQLLQKGGVRCVLEYLRVNLPDVVINRLSELLPVIHREFTGIS